MPRNGETSRLQRGWLSSVDLALNSTSGNVLGVLHSWCDPRQETRAESIDARFSYAWRGGGINLWMNCWP